MTTPVLSVVIPCYNSEATLERQVGAILQQGQSTEDVEILLVNNRSSDDTEEVISRLERNYPQVRGVVADRAQGINVARNDGALASRSGFLIFCDSDDVVQAGWLDAYRVAVQNGATLVGGPVDRLLPDGSMVTRDNSLYTLYWDIPWPIGANCGVSRKVFAELGGFDEEYCGGGDETDFFWRAQLAGHHLEFVPGARVSYFLRGPLRQVARQHFAYGRSHVRLYLRFRDQGMPRSSVVRALTSVLSGVAEGMLAIVLTRRRRAVVSRLAVRAGRFVESTRKRVWYL